MNKDQNNINTLQSCKIFLGNSEIESKDMLLIVKSLCAQREKITIDNLSLNRLESLLRAILIKRSMLEHIEIEELIECKLGEYVEKLEQYTTEANLLIKQIEKSGQLESYVNQIVN